jgi:hypothetical protein
MASYQAKRAADSNPMAAGNWADPLGRDRRVRRGAAAPAVEVIEENRGPAEGWVITIVTRNTT